MKLQHELPFQNASARPVDFNLAPQFLAKVLVIYEDYNTGIRAKYRYEELTRHIEPESKELSMWKTDHLSHKGIRNLATLEASEAHLVIVSVSGEETLSEPTREWLSDWLARSDKQTYALLALVDVTETLDGDAPTVGELRHAIGGSSVRFFCELAEPTPAFTTWRD